MSGGAASFGEGFRDAMRLLDLSDPKRFQYELIFEDDQLNPAKTVLAAQKLIHANHVDAIISWGSGTGYAINPLAEKHKVIHFNMNSDPAVARGFYNFTHRTPARELVRVFVEELSRRKIKSLSVIALKHHFSKAILKELKLQTKGTPVQIKGVNSFDFGTRDFRTLALKTSASAPDLLLLLSFQPELELLTRQIKELGVNIPVTSMECIDYSDALSLFEGSWYVGSVDPSRDFLQNFETHYHRLPEAASANGYDMLKLIVAAYEGFEGAAKPTPEEAVRRLHQLKDFPGVLGTLTMDEEGVVLSKAVVKIIRDKKAVLIEK